MPDTTTGRAPATTPAKVAELIAADEPAGHVTPADVRQAEQDAKDAAALVAVLERRVVDGDEDITPAELAAQRDLSGFAKLRAQATARKAERAARAARLKECDQLRAEIEAYATNTGERYVELLQAAETAVSTFTDAVRDRNAQLDDWRHRMVDLRVPEHGNPLVPPAEHAHLGIHGHRVIAGRRRLDTVDPGEWLGRMLSRVARHHDPTRGLRANSGHSNYTIPADSRTDPDFYLKLARVDAPAGDPPDNIRFFLTTGGGVIEMDHEPTEAEAHGIVREISRKEAWGR